MSTAPELLKKAADIMEERGKQYDQEGGERSMGKCVTAFNAITGRDLTEPEGWLLLQLLKDVRQFTGKGYHQDSAEDCIAYAALKAESLVERSIPDEYSRVNIVSPSERYGPTVSRDKFTFQDPRSEK